MKQLVSALARYYDYIFIDCPAGLGAGFASAVAAAERALLVSTPDPVCLRNAARTRVALEHEGLLQQRLVVNRFSGEAFRRQGVYHSLDDVIDAGRSPADRRHSRRSRALPRRARAAPGFRNTRRARWPSGGWRPVWKANRSRLFLSADFSFTNRITPTKGGVTMNIALIAHDAKKGADGCNSASRIAAF